MNDIKTLHKYAIKPLLDKSINKRFLTQSEFKENIGDIFIVTGAIRNLHNKLKK